MSTNGYHHLRENCTDKEVVFSTVARCSLCGAVGAYVPEFRCVNCMAKVADINDRVEMIQQVLKLVLDLQMRVTCLHSELVSLLKPANELCQSVNEQHRCRVITIDDPTFVRLCAVISQLKGYLPHAGEDSRHNQA
jgi:hypothetical protein